MSLVSRVPALAPFEVRSFRFQWPADLLASWAFEMDGIILGWFVLVSTGSVLMLALFGSLQFLGALISPFFGMAGDRIGYRNLLCLMRLTYVVVALALIALFLSGLAAPVPVLLLATVMGLVRPSDVTMRTLLVGETMPGPLLMRAMGVSRTTADMARIAGALTGAGLVASFSSGALLGSTALSTHGAWIRPARTMIACALGWFTLNLAFSWIETPRLGEAVLFVAGFVQSFCMLPMAVILCAPPIRRSAAA